MPDQIAGIGALIRCAGITAVGWAKARQRRAHHPFTERISWMVATLSLLPTLHSLPAAASSAATATTARVTQRLVFARIEIFRVAQRSVAIGYEATAHSSCDFRKPAAIPPDRSRTMTRTGSAKQSMSPLAEKWIASSLALLAMTGRE